MKKLVIAIAILLALGAGFFIWRAKQAKGTESADKLSTQKVAVADVQVGVSSTGKVVSNQDFDVKCKAQGPVLALPFDVGAVVKKGQLVVEIDPVDEDRNVKGAQVALDQSNAKLKQAQLALLIAQSALKTANMRAEAAVTNAQVHLTDAQQKFDRRKQLLEEKLMSQEEYDAASTAVAQAASDLELAQAQREELKQTELGLKNKDQDIAIAKSLVESDDLKLKDAQQRLIETKVYSPSDGIVSARNVQVGTIISSATSNVGGGTTIMTISDFSHIFVQASVDESDIDKVKVGMRVIATADGLPGVKLDGVVVMVPPKGVNTSNVVTFPVKVEITDKQRDRLKGEMTANVKIISEERDKVLVVPTQAVTKRDRKSFVTVVKADGSTDEREVATGLEDTENIEVLNGLQKDEVVQVKKFDQSKWRADQARGGPFGGGRR